ncbi:acetyl/propionyl/methylcrotonyl-CoA carboxylase subunit alpha [Pelagibacterium sp. H642]|uniref:acetyl/propionyl/methylcrotonyl-CoA carboxylase subunit alpha n=1 Tax=Pelagibacterium sp. H642 TaxID=1881069 RepID=UPI00281608F9|nr:acetyl/propionyl/methylcrotonyl-CoA carboxylase subunit alpha [Pelagibacterium sp. H642]WMT90828.1 acetyl/propionyl/methylcrotonyl-CoA carboxylase subunit alpha [Pelagibacterium sp. H642]
MVKRLLIANRGEIACRIIRTARRMGVETIAVFSDADAGALHVRMADGAVHIGPSPASESYLDGAKIIAAAKESGADAIHPGFGFLSENAQFAQAVMDAGLTWVGPDPASIEAMGLKDAAKRLMAEAGVPITPGYMGEDQSLDRLIPAADEIGYPVLIKAVAGGGGKGMRRVERKEDFSAALESCRREAKAAFGDDRVLIEKYITRPRHIEVQVFGDRHGNVVHLFERDCSVQRRHQKVIEEAPAPGMDEVTREAICAAAVKAAQAVNYVGAGTIEFIADATEGLKPDRVWFMEMNTRLQVEHPVTEQITGVDLVEWQLRIAAGEHLPKSQEDLRFSGWSVEARLYAEDPARDFMPSTGRLEIFDLPGGVRVETGVERGDAITSFYDPMIAKLIATCETREQAVDRLRAACEAVAIYPVKTNAAFLARVLGNAEFRAGGVDTGFIERHGEALTRSGEPSAQVLELAAQSFLPEGQGPWQRLVGFRMNAEQRREVRMRFGDSLVLAAPPSSDPASPAHLLPPGEKGPLGPAFVHGPQAPNSRLPPLPFSPGGRRWPRSGRMRGAPRTQAPRLIRKSPHQALIAYGGEVFAFTPDRTEASHGAAAGDGAIAAPIPGKISAIAVQNGQEVSKGDTLLILEAMKMEYTLSAPFNGVVEEVTAAVGDQVTEGAVLVRIGEEGR